MRQRRVRAKVSGTASRPRLSVFRSNAHLYAQLIDDESGKTLCAASDKDVSKKGTGATVASAREIGALVAKKAIEHGITSAVFDRAGYKYHGQVKALAEGAREGGLVF